MATFHLHASPIRRAGSSANGGGGRSTVAAAAYISGEEITDERTGETYKYGGRERVFAADVVLPEGGTMDHKELWNRVELSHKRKDAITGYTIDAALPHEVSHEEWIPIAAKMAQAISDNYGVGVEYAIHTSSGQFNNPHVHFQVSACHMTSDGRTGPKCVELDPIHCRQHRIDNSCDWLRPQWALEVNAALERAGFKERVDSRSYEDRGIDKTPTIHVGWRNDSAEREGINEAIQAENDYKAYLKDMEREAMLPVWEAEEQERERAMEEFYELPPGSMASKPKETQPADQYEAMIARMEREANATMENFRRAAYGEDRKPEPQPEPPKPVKQAPRSIEELIKPGMTWNDLAGEAVKTNDPALCKAYLDKYQASLPAREEKVVTEAHLAYKAQMEKIAAMDFDSEKHMVAYYKSNPFEEPAKKLFEKEDDFQGRKYAATEARRSELGRERFRYLASVYGRQAAESYPQSMAELEQWRKYGTRASGAQRAANEAKRSLVPDATLWRKVREIADRPAQERAAKEREQDRNSRRDRDQERGGGGWGR